VLLGPRTPDQRVDLLALADVRLDDQTLAAIDVLVPPGTDINPADAGYDPPSLDPHNLRS
jgi:aryl-alcohol dehydrogenase (NADP+)